MLNTHKCLLESGVDIQERLESHLGSKRMGIFWRPRSASLGHTPKKTLDQAAGQRAEVKSLVSKRSVEVRDLDESMTRRFVRVQVAEVRVYSCYFSTNEPFEIFETQILLLEENLREASGRSLIAGDFNSKSPEWGEARLDRRGILVGEMFARNDLIVSNQGRDFTFRRGATKGRRGTGKRKGFCALISIDIRNAFNTTRWNICIEAMVRKKVPDYLMRMIDDYLSDRWVIYEGDKWSLKEEMTCGAPQGSRMGPLVWNVMYDDFLHRDLPTGTSIIGFAGNALVCAAGNVGILELRINDSLWRAKALLR